MSKDCVPGGCKIHEESVLQALMAKLPYMQFSKDKVISWPHLKWCLSCTWTRQCIYLCSILSYIQSWRSRSFIRWMLGTFLPFTWRGLNLFILHFVVVVCRQDEGTSNLFTDNLQVDNFLCHYCIWNSMSNTPSKGASLLYKGAGCQWCFSIGCLQGCHLVFCAYITNHYAMTVASRADTNFGRSVLV